MSTELENDTYSEKAQDAAYRYFNNDCNFIEERPLKDLIRNPNLWNSTKLECIVNDELHMRLQHGLSRPMSLKMMTRLFLEARHAKDQLEVELGRRLP